MNLTIVLFVVGTLITTLVATVNYIGKEIVAQLKSIAISVHKIEVDLGKLSTDHDNLKSEVKDIKERIKLLEV